MRRCAGALCPSFFLPCAPSAGGNVQLAAHVNLFQRVAFFFAKGEEKILGPFRRRRIVFWGCLFQGSPRENCRGNIAAEFHGNCDYFTFPCKYRSRGPTEPAHDVRIPVPNVSRRDSSFPFPPKRFPWKCLFFRGFPFPRRTIPWNYRSIDVPNRVALKL